MQCPECEADHIDIQVCPCGMRTVLQTSASRAWGLLMLIDYQQAPRCSACTLCSQCCLTMQGVPCSWVSPLCAMPAGAGAHLPQGRAMEVGRDGHALQARAVYAARRPEGVLLFAAP